MPLAKSFAISLLGLSGTLVEVEVDISSNLPGLTTVLLCAQAHCLHTAYRFFCYVISYTSGIWVRTVDGDGLKLKAALFD